MGGGGGGGGGGEEEVGEGKEVENMSVVFYLERTDNVTSIRHSQFQPGQLSLTPL